MKDHPNYKRNKNCDYHGGSCINVWNWIIKSQISKKALCSRFGVFGTDIKELNEENPIWDYVAYYLAQICFTYTLFLSVEKVIIGGDILFGKEFVFDLIRYYLDLELNECLISDSLKGYIWNNDRSFILCNK